MARAGQYGSPASRGRASGVPHFRITVLQTASAGGEDLRRGLLEPRPQPLPALLRLLVALTRNAKKLPVANRLGQDDPLDLRLLRRQVELLQVAEEEQPRQLRAPEDL